MADFSGLGLAPNIALFAIAAVAVWAAGTRLATHADVIARKTGIGSAVVGMFLLAGVTSLPELAVIVSASLRDNAQLAINSIFGGVAMQVAILVLADVVLGRRALTAVVPEPVTMLQGVLGILMLSVAAGGMLVGDVAVLGIGLWSWAIFALYLGSIWLLARDPGRRPWVAATDRRSGRQVPGGERSTRDRDAKQSRGTLGGTVARAAIAAVVIFAAGYVLSVTGEAIAEETGLGQSFAGFALVAISTSLPEVSTVFAAARLGLYTMAISDIFGTNLFDISLMFVADAVTGGEAVLNRADTFSIFGAVLGIAVTAVYVAGIAERRDTTVLRMGLDSVTVLLVYAGGVVLLFTMR